MVFEFTVTVPANTAKATPVREDLELAHGIIHKLDIIFPFGCRGKVFLVLRRALHQVFPTNPDGSFTGEGFPISYPVFQELEEEPYRLQAYAWSPGTTYSHDVIVRLGILPREVLMPPRAELPILRKIEQLIFGRR